MRVYWQPFDAKSPNASDRVPERTEIAREHQWDLEAAYPDAAAWEQDFARIDALTAPLEAMRGRLNGPEAIAAMFEADTALNRLVERLYTYAHLRADEDTAHQGNQARQARIRAKLTEVAGRLAWITPEILSHSEDELRAWTDAPTLAPNRFAMVQLLRRKPHTLSENEETLLSRAGEVFAAPRQIFNFLTNADMRFPEITDAQGVRRELSQGRYLTFLLNADRRVRRDAFNAMYDTYGAYKNTLASALAANVKLHNYLARSRHFNSAIEATLHGEHIPVAVYETLIAATRAALPHFHRYIDLRRRRLALDDLDMCDMYVPIVPECEIKVPFEQAREWVAEALQPLGAEYAATLGSAFADRWIDVYENRGKKSGAYSGGCYDTLPYILMNYQGTLDSVFTLAHELGHSMHSWLANRAQPHRFAEYPIFIAEIASTLNEALLLRHLLQTAREPALRAYLLNHACDEFKGTVFRQTLFAEFEKRIHEMDATGQPLTHEALSEPYYAMNADYYGPQVRADRRIALEWSRIPHFYYNFYVYKYATSFCASQIFVRRVLESPPQRDQYLDLLRAGGSEDPLDLIRKAGVDLTDRATFESGFEEFGRTIDELERTLQELDRSRTARTGAD